ncbi:Bacteriophage P22, Gp10, DNA-stabilising [uncultured Caudovirales phage]|uniref:Bacteriophage P22, Gp10, DNA-stabilising n=1 Tax=uncultured Caudovirales phage TaxID=2100421 RepID=A0A6J7WAS8_9CAUD|nr:Bacteriophage P22, Gp10, DNA-stabilising [uncultured Caudovirales phage]CAB5187185.1 Bacteriophage P22, Gp10, DNA-stabilising [uncultured Caudovirales phage]
MQTPILGSAYVARSVNAADNRMVNLFPEATAEGGQTAGFLNRAPGLRLLASVGAGPIRGLWPVKGVLYVVSGQAFYKVDTSYVATLLGTITGQDPVSISDNGSQIFIAANPDGYIYNVNTGVFAEITDPDFVGASTVGFLDGYFVFTQPNSQTFWVTELYDGTSVDPLSFASAEGSPDDLVAVNVDHREAWLFGTNSVEVWYDAGTPDFPLQRIQGAYMEVGCAAAYSVAKLDNSLFWLGRDMRGRGIVYRAKGYTGVRVSTHAIEFAIQNYGNISDAIAYSYQQEGHSFYVLTFPSANATWVYDASTQIWHERAGFSNGVFTRHRSNCQAAFNSEIVVGDYQNGNIYAFDLDVYADNGAMQKWLRSWRALPSDANNLKRTTQHSLQLVCESGVGLQRGAEAIPAFTIASGGIAISPIATSSIAASSATISVPYTPEEYVSGANPQIMLRWSDDGGHTWSNEHWRSMGAIGEYGRRVLWRRLGMTMKLRDRVYEISGTDPVKVAIMGAQLILDGTNA